MNIDAIAATWAQSCSDSSIVVFLCSIVAGFRRDVPRSSSVSTWLGWTLLAAGASLPPPTTQMFAMPDKHAPTTCPRFCAVPGMLAA